MAFLYHAGDDRLRHNEGSYQVNVDDTAEILDVHLLHRDALDDAGIVHQDVDGAYGSLDVGHHGLDGFFVGDVAEVSLGVYAEFLICCETAVYGLLTGAVEYNLRAGFGERACDSKPDSVSGTGD